MNAYKSAYLGLFNRVTDGIDALEVVLRRTDLSVDALRAIGMAREGLKTAQLDAEERILSA